MSEKIRYTIVEPDPANAFAIAVLVEKLRMGEEAFQMREMARAVEPVKKALSNGDTCIEDQDPETIRKINEVNEASFNMLSNSK